MDALDGVIDQVPEWHTLLDNLNSQIALRQYELAELGGDRPPTRSLRPKGSTESLLRPKETDEHAILEDENTVGAPQDPLQPPALTKDTAFPTTPTPKHTVHAFSNGSPPRLLHHSSSPGPAPLQRRTSQRLNSHNVPPKYNLPTVQRKRKTESIASGESQAPKYRTRSMIIVYYDSAVQHAFEELVKLISASRNAMRKGKMAARMADMKKMAEMETASDEEETSASNETPSTDANNNRPTIIPGNNGLQADKDDSELPKLQFVSTRRMGPSRDSPAAALLRNKANNGHLSGPGRRMMLPGYRGSPNGREPGSFVSIFDELDTGLEWCQSMCEHAAHQFLRDGACDTEITGIKKRLWEVKEIAEREKAKVQAEEQKEKEKKEKMEREKDKEEEKAREGTQEEPRDESVRCTRKPDESRGMKSIQVHKSLIASKSLEVDKIEIDDEGYDDLLPTRQWRSARENVA